MKGIPRMRSVKISKYINYLERNGVTPQDIMSTLKGDREYIMTMRNEGERQKLTIRKDHDTAFMGYRPGIGCKGGKWEVPYGDLKLVDEIIEKIKDR